ncbi:MAG TPA: copper-binding protein [Burkholderiales bacterium]|jgi:Cu/Ag efflux protein CusF|nr:copper-binding protein [Burkholderiales bacterium]
MKKRIILAAASAIAAMPPAALAQSGHSAHHDKGAQVAQASAALAEGEIRRVDKEAKKLTIKHGPIANLDMPAMTMVFQVKDPAMLDQVKAGDKVKFQAEKDGGQYIVTKIQK